MSLTIVYHPPPNISSLISSLVILLDDSAAALVTYFINPGRYQPCFQVRAFALAVPSAWYTFPTDICITILLALP